MDVFRLIALVVAGALWGAWLVFFLREKGTLGDILARFERLGVWAKVGVLFVVVQLAMFGGAKHGGTNDVDGLAPRSPRRVVQNHPAAVVAASDAVRGYRLESVSTNAEISCAMPADASVRGTWHLTGAYEDILKVGLGDFRFPLGTNLCASLWAHTWGKVRPRFRGVTNEIAAVGTPLSASPGVSRFWAGATTNGTYLLTWEDFVLGRRRIGDTSPLPTVLAQIELFGNGDFVTRSNAVESVYRRVNPDDWDDDGIANDADDEPLTAAGELQFGPHQTLPEGANSNAYCWVEIVVRQANARVVFAGDGASDLADPRFIAKAGEVHRVIAVEAFASRVLHLM